MRSLIIRLFILLGLCFPALASAVIVPKFAYVANGNSNNISVYTIDPTTGALTAGTAVAAGTQPYAVTVDPSGKFAYVANKDSNDVSVYTINQTTGALTAGTPVAAGTWPASVTVDPSGKFVYVANTGSANVSVYTVNQITGALTAGTAAVTGSGTESFTIGPSGKFAYVANTNSNNVSVYTINQATGALTAGTAVAAGTSPRSVTVDPSGKFAYVRNMYSGNISVYTINQTTGALTAGTAVAVGTSPMSLAVDPSGKFAYVADGGSKNVSLYMINQTTGALTAGAAVAAGTWPISVTVDPSGKFAYVANANSNDVSVYTINQTTGALTAGTVVAAGTGPRSVITTTGTGSSSAPATGAALNLPTSWYLLGNSSASPIDVATAFGDATKVTTVWKWNKAASKWAFYSPLMTPTALATYTQGKGYDTLISIASKEGFWVNASTVVALTGSNGVTLVEGDLQQGWNLAGSADNKTPSQLNQDLSSSLSAAGKAITTIWAWDTPNKKWEFYAPSLEAKGGAALADYITSKGYLPFSAALSASDGFWLSIGALGAPTVTGMNTSTGVAGATVTIIGTNFSPTPENNTVKFNGILATVTAATTTSLTVTVPVGATTGKVSVTTSGGAATSVGSFTGSTVWGGPIVTGMNPSIGTVGTHVTITGSNFDTNPANNTVKFNGTKATVTAATATSLTATVPNGATTGTVSVATAIGTATSLFSFGVGNLGPPQITSMIPKTGAEGTTVLIQGNNFALDSIVYFHGLSTSIVRAGVISATTTSITVKVPIGAVTGKVFISTLHASSLANLATFSPATTADSFAVIVEAFELPIGTLTITGPLSNKDPSFIGSVTPIVLSGLSSDFGINYTATSTTYGVTSTTYYEEWIGGATVNSTWNKEAGTLSIVVSEGYPNVYKVGLQSPISQLSYTSYKSESECSLAGPSTNWIETCASWNITVNQTNQTITFANTPLWGGSMVSPITGLLKGTLRLRTRIGAPTITNISPSTGGGGTSVTITGTNFDTIFDKNKVSFNGALGPFASPRGSEARVTAATATSLTVIVPDVATSGKIFVETADGTASSASDYSVSAPPTVDGMNTSTGAAGIEVIITGTNFDINPANNTVLFNGIKATVMYASARSLTVKVPSGAKTGPISVTTPVGTAISANSFTVIINTPTVTCPNTGSSGQGILTISGALSCYSLSIPYAAMTNSKDVWGDSIHYNNAWANMSTYQNASITYAVGDGYDANTDTLFFQGSPQGGKLFNIGGNDYTPPDGYTLTGLSNMTCVVRGPNLHQRPLCTDWGITISRSSGTITFKDTPVFHVDLVNYVVINTIKGTMSGSLSFKPF